MKSTKKSLVGSALVLLLCLVMLVGTTFAWFTDSVTSAGNKIQAGKLNIDLLVKDTWDGEYKSVKESKEAIFDHDKWEPGYTDVKYIKVETTGNLALKYTLSITPYDAVEAGDLAEVIDVYYAPEAVRVIDRDTSGLKKLGTLKDVFDGAENTVISDTLIPEPKDGDTADTEDFATIVLKMQETAGNEYQGLSVGGGFDLRLLATQYTYEEDSFDDQYDAGAEYAINSGDYDSLQEAVDAANGYTVNVEGNQSLTTALNISNDITLNLGSSVIDGENNGGNGVNIRSDSKNVVIRAGTGGIAMDSERCIAVSARNSDITIDGGNYSVEGTNNAYFMEDRSGGSNNVTVQNITYTGDRGVQFSNSDNNTILVKDSSITATGYSAIFIGGNNNVCTLENVTINGNRVMAADSSHTGSDGYSIIYIKSGTYNCDLVTNENCTISITGGSFSDNPTEYLADGYKAERIDGMWVVSAE